MEKASSNDRPEAGSGGTFEIGGVRVARGTVETVHLPISRLSTHTEMTLPVRVLHGAKPGPAIFVSAGIHGDEIIGVEIIRRVLSKLSVRSLSGTVICVPVVNVFGFIQHQRYLPDRRDLNRSFPGSTNGSLAAQLAHVFMEEIILRCSYGVDLHSAALHRTNFPQIRISEDRPQAAELAEAFGAPAIIQAPLREGSLRQTAAEAGVDVILYESGEALRFDELAIRIGVKGVLNVMAHLGMRTRKSAGKVTQPIRSKRTHWVRAPEGGLFRALKASGASVEKGDILGYLSDPFGDVDIPLESKVDGVVIGRTNLPVVNQGDALMHIAEVKLFSKARERVEEITEAARADPMFDEDEVI